MRYGMVRYGKVGFGPVCWGMVWFEVSGNFSVPWYLRYGGVSGIISFAGDSTKE